MSANAYLPAIEALKAKVTAKEEEIAPLRAQVAAKDAEINPLREMVNNLCKEAGLDPVYSIAAAPAEHESGPKLRFRPDQFYNKDLSEAAVEYLTAKKAADSTGSPTPATTDEIYAALTTHGYSFNGSSDATNKVALKTALTRNTAQVAKIKDDLYGLRTWYGMRAKYKRSADSDEPASGDPTPAATKAEASATSAATSASTKGNA